MPVTIKTHRCSNKKGIAPQPGSWYIVTHGGEKNRFLAYFNHDKVFDPMYEFNPVYHDQPVMKAIKVTLPAFEVSGYEIVEDVTNSMILEMESRV